MILPLVTWGYHLIPDQWQAALDRWEGLNFANPLSVLRWNTDKSYLMDVQAKGVAVVPTRMSDALTPADLDAARVAFGAESLVIKPPVSAGSEGTHLLRDGVAPPASALGQRMMIQPEMAAISIEGEYSLFYFDGVFSHAILKSCASGEFRVQPQFGGQSRTVEAEPAMRTLAEAALAAAPGAITYARVDMVRDGDQFRLMELELIEPFLFLNAAPDGGRAFVAAVQRASAG